MRISAARVAGQIAVLIAVLISGLMIGAGVVTAQQVSDGQGALLRGLDKVNGQVSDMEVGAGGFVELGRLEIALKECRYPAGNPTGDAYAYLTIREKNHEAPVFEGWMIASAPALNGLDHARYDVWVMRCKTS